MLYSQIACLSTLSLSIKAYMFVLFRKSVEMAGPGVNIFARDCRHTLEGVVAFVVTFVLLTKNLELTCHVASHLP